MAWPKCFNIVFILFKRHLGDQIFQPLKDKCLIYRHLSDLASGRMCDISTVLHLLFEELSWHLCMCIPQTKHEILPCKVSTLSLYIYTVHQIHFPVHTAVLIMCNNLLTLCTQTAYTFSFLFPFQHL